MVEKVIEFFKRIDTLEKYEDMTSVIPAGLFPISNKTYSIIIRNKLFDDLLDASPNEEIPDNIEEWLTYEDVSIFYDTNENALKYLSYDKLLLSQKLRKFHILNVNDFDNQIDLSGAEDSYTNPGIQSYTNNKSDFAPIISFAEEYNKLVNVFYLPARFKCERIVNTYLHFDDVQKKTKCLINSIPEYMFTNDLSYDEILRRVCLCCDVITYRCVTPEMTIEEILNKPSLHLRGDEWKPYMETNGKIKDYVKWLVSFISTYKTPALNGFIPEYGLCIALCLIHHFLTQKYSEIWKTKYCQIKYNFDDDDEQQEQEYLIKNINLGLLNPNDELGLTALSYYISLSYSYYTDNIDRPILYGISNYRESRIRFRKILENGVNSTEKTDIVSTIPVKENKSKAENLSLSCIDKLNALVGLDAVKNDVNNLVNLVKMQIKRKQQGLKVVPVSLHLVFSGNPGTGKTTVARILAEIYKEIGVLSKGQLIEVDRSGLVAGYVGQTAIKTQEKIDEAMGGVLFIDEAYTLVKDGQDFGQEAIDTILKAMEDHRDNFIVIVAGYSNLMKGFINSNPGLKSRFNKYIFFPDYSADELIQIFHSMCNEYQYKLTEAAERTMSEKIISMEMDKDDNFANARDVRNMFEAVITNQASRLAFSGSNSDIMEITDEDFI